MSKNDSSQQLAASFQMSYVAAKSSMNYELMSDPLIVPSVTLKSVTPSTMITQMSRTPSAAFITRDLSAWTPLHCRACRCGALYSMEFPCLSGSLLADWTELHWSNLPLAASNSISNAKWVCENQAIRQTKTSATNLLFPWPRNS